LATAFSAAGSRPRASPSAPVTSPPAAATAARARLPLWGDDRRVWTRQSCTLVVRGRGVGRSFAGRLHGRSASVIKPGGGATISVAHSVMSSTQCGRDGRTAGRPRCSSPSGAPNDTASSVRASKGEAGTSSCSEFYRNGANGRAPHMFSVAKQSVANHLGLGAARAPESAYGPSSRRQGIHFIGCSRGMTASTLSVGSK
jgi:hypothetical protein